MSDEEVDELLKAVDTSSGELNYMGKTGQETHDMDCDTDNGTDMVKMILQN